MLCSVPLEGRDGLEQSQEMKLAACSRLYSTLARIWGWLWSLTPLGYPRGVGHHASGDEFELETPNHY